MSSSVGVCAGNWFNQYKDLYSLSTVYDSRAGEISIQGYEVLEFDLIFELDRTTQIVIFTPLYRDLYLKLSEAGFDNIRVGGPPDLINSFDVSFAYMPVLGRARRACNTSDPIRYSTIELLCYELSSRNIFGSIAEVGVYKADTLLHMHLCMPERKLFAFDTFEGFSERDLISEGYCFPSKNFKDTSLELVLNKLRVASEKGLLNVRPGYFPESIAEADEQEIFSIVSLDADLYEPMLAGLKFFSRRMSRGGYIIVHNYNDFTYPGTRKAVDDFLRELDGLNMFCPAIVPVSDPGGTLVLGY